VCIHRRHPHLLAQVFCPQISCLEDLLCGYELLLDFFLVGVEGHLHLLDKGKFCLEEHHDGFSERFKRVHLCSCVLGNSHPDIILVRVHDAWIVENRGHAFQLEVNLSSSPMLKIIAMVGLPYL
jgi:hypothetical protein